MQFKINSIALLLGSLRLIAAVPVEESAETSLNVGDTSAPLYERVCNLETLDRGEVEHCARDLDDRGKENCVADPDGQFCRHGNAYVSGVSLRGRRTTAKCSDVATAVWDIYRRCAGNGKERDRNNEPRANLSGSGSNAAFGNGELIVHVKDHYVRYV